MYRVTDNLLATLFDSEALCSASVILFYKSPNIRSSYTCAQTDWV